MDITFSKDAKEPKTCSNSTNVGEAPFAFGGVDLVPESAASTEGKAADGKTETKDKGSAAVGLKVSSTFAALTMVVVAGLMI